MINGHPQSWDEAFEANDYTRPVDERIRKLEADRDILAATLRQALDELDQACWVSAERMARWRTNLDDHGGATVPDIADHTDRISHAINNQRSTP